MILLPLFFCHHDFMAAMVDINSKKKIFFIFLNKNELPSIRKL